jgi:hypothetical protein
MKPLHGKPAGMTLRDAQMEQREALVQILETGQKDIEAGNSHYLAEFPDQLDGADPDQSVLACGSTGRSTIGARTAQMICHFGPATGLRVCRAER